jgi:crotonobetainyl-CoA:carnitine CoA-transferase CaiB-like acyl-CoA transferase
VSGPLDGVLVVDLSRVLAGPFCTMLLADLGARVVKVEAPEGGDVTRAWGPPWDPATGLSAYYLSVNRNKESIVLDLAAEAGREAVRILARRADVVVENFPPGGLEKFGLSLAAMRSENPRLVTASITGYGRAGPDASAPGFDLLAQAGSGLMAITGTPDGPATKVGVAVSDLLAGAFAATGIAAALFGREASGRGAHVEIDLFRSSLAALVNVGQASLLTGEEAKRHGNAHPQIVPYRTFAASDGDFVIAAGTDPQFARLAGVVGRPEWAADPRYRTNPARVENRRELEAALESILRGAPRETWLARCRAAGVPAGPVRGPLEALTSEGARATGAVLSAGGLSFLATPLAVEGHTPRLDFPPALDADGDRLRREFGLPAAEDGRRKTEDGRKRRQGEGKRGPR